MGGNSPDAAFQAVKRFGHVVSSLGWGSHCLAPQSFKLEQALKDASPVSCGFLTFPQCTQRASWCRNANEDDTMTLTSVAAPGAPIKEPATIAAVDPGHRE